MGCRGGCQQIVGGEEEGECNRPWGEGEAAALVGEEEYSLGLRIRFRIREKDHIYIGL